MRRFLLLAYAPLALARPAAAAESGVFCGDVNFIERVEPNGMMTFSVTGANRQGHIISLAGSAAPRRDGWRYQVKSDAVPNDRCTLDIEARSGGFRLHTVDGARCVNGGGEMAYVAVMDVDLPAATRIKGAVPIADQYGLADFNCANKTFAVTPPAAQQSPAHDGDRAEASGPIRGTLAEVLAMYGKGKMGPFASDSVMRKHFTTGFITAWDHGIAASPPVIDADPLVSGQIGVEALRLTGLTVVSQTSNSAIVEMGLAQTTLDNSRSSGTLKVWMRQEDTSWKIDDIQESEAGTWRGYIQKSLAR